VIFGARSSPHILGATLQKHIKGYKEMFKATAQTLLEETYVDDIQGEAMWKKTQLHLKKRLPMLCQRVVSPYTNSTVMWNN